MTTLHMGTASYDEMKAAPCARWGATVWSVCAAAPAAGCTPKLASPLAQAIAGNS
jgi:hypothetical protein